MGVPTQSAGIASETAAAAATNGFIGWSPETDRTVYTVTGPKRGPAEITAPATRGKQFYR